MVPGMLPDDFVGVIRIWSKNLDGILSVYWSLEETHRLPDSVNHDFAVERMRQEFGIDDRVVVGIRRVKSDSATALGILQDTDCTDKRNVWGGNV